MEPMGEILQAGETEFGKQMVTDSLRFAEFCSHLFKDCRWVTGGLCWPLYRDALDVQRHEQQEATAERECRLAHDRSHAKAS